MSSRFILVSGLPETATEKDMQALCAEFGAIRSIKVSRNDKGYITGSCEFDHSDYATKAVRSINSENNSLRASFVKSRFNSQRCCNLKVKYLPRNVAQEEVMSEFGRFGVLSRCKVIAYERNAIAHLVYETIESAELAKNTMNNRHWKDSPESPVLSVDFNSFNGRKSNSDEDPNHNNPPPPLPLEDVYHGNSHYYNYSQGFYNPAEMQPQKAQYVQFNPYSWAPAMNGVAKADSNAGGQQWAQMYNQLVQHMQNTQLYQPAGHHQNHSQFAGQPMLMNPQPLYCATPVTPQQQQQLIYTNNTQHLLRGAMPVRYPMVSAAAPPRGYVRSSNNTLYVYNTGNSMTEEGLKALFSRFGTIIDVSVPKDPNTGASRNFGFVNYLDAAAAALAIEQMNGFMLYDRMLQVSYKRPRASQQHPKHEVPKKDEQNNMTAERNDQ